MTAVDLGQLDAATMWAMGAERQQRMAVVDEAMTWLGTPYHHCADVKGIGVDCAMILMRTYSVAGLVEFVDPRPYPPEWHLHHSEEMYVAWLERMGARRVQAPALGDVVLFRFGRCFSHGSVVVAMPGALDETQVVHAYLNRGVHLTRLREEPLAGRDRQFWSLW
jgi:cell wall-associated NlpC family hydrolase